MSSRPTEAEVDGPAPAAAAVSAAVPVYLDSFVGRDAEIGDLRRALGAARLVTIVGPGGVGKTRLAAAVARAWLAEAGTPVHWVDLVAVSDPAHTMQAVASSLGVSEHPGAPLAARVLQHLSAHPLLLVMDNAEHLIGAVAEGVHQMLLAAPEVRILVTSRERVEIAGELVWPAPTLAVPAGDPHHWTLAEVESLDAVRLFADRAKAARREFTLEGSAAAVAEICARLDGLPLAIELAAARVAALSPEQIAQRLRKSVAFLGSGRRTAHARQLTLHATIRWSFDLLEEREKSLLRRLCVFVDGFTMDAAEFVGIGGGIEDHEVLDLVARLIGKSLVVFEERGEPRYRILETIRTFGLEELRRSGEEEVTCERHAEFFLRQAEEVERFLVVPDAEGGAPEVAALVREMGNVWSAIRWCEESGRHTAWLLRLGWVLHGLWFIQGQWSAGCAMLEAALQGSADVDPLVRARAHAALAHVYMFLGQAGRNAPQLAESVAVLREGRDPTGLTYALMMLGVATAPGDPGRAVELLEEAVQHALGQPRHSLVSFALYWLGWAHVAAGNLPEAGAALTRARGELQRHRHTTGLGHVMTLLGRIAEASSGTPEAWENYQAGLKIHSELNDIWGTAHAVAGIARTLVATEEYATAARLLGGVDAIFRRLGGGVPASEASDNDRVWTRVEQAMGPEMARRLYEEGSWLSAEQIVDLALRRPKAPGLESPQPHLDVSPAPAPESPAAPRPVEVPARPRPAAELVVHTLGRAEVVAMGRVLSSSDWVFSKPRELFFYLLCHRSRTKEQIALALWPESSSAQVRNQFHVALHHLRKTLGSTDWVVFDRERYQFNRSLAYEYDVEQFQAAAAEGLALKRQESPEAAGALARAAALYRGDYLHEESFGDWYLEERTRLQHQAVEVFEALAGLHASRGDHGRAAEAYGRLLGVDNLHLKAHRGLIQAHADAGDAVLAIRSFRVYVELWENELGLGPDREIVAMVERIRAGTAA